MAITERDDVDTFRVDESKFVPPAYDPFRKVVFDRNDDPIWPRIDERRRSLDTLTVDVIEWGLEAAIEEAEAAVERTARSTIIREQHDYRASLNTVDCNSVTHVSWAATADPVRVFYRLEEMRDGDVFLYNDVHQSCGTLGHLPDYCVVIPVFSDERVIGFAQIFGHCNDVSGRVVGSWPITSRSTFEEGMLCPPVKLYDQGELNEEVWRIILRNSRFTDDLRGDIDAFIGAARIITRRTKELCERHDTDTVEAAFYRIIDRCEEMVREEALPMIPNGEYVGEDFVENDGINLDDPVKIKVTVRKDPDKMIVDFEGTDPQTEGPINWPMDGRHYSKWLGGFVKAQVPGMIVNEGMTRVFRCYLPPRTVLSARVAGPERRPNDVHAADDQRLHRRHGQGLERRHGRRLPVHPDLRALRARSSRINSSSTGRSSVQARELGGTRTEPTRSTSSRTPRTFRRNSSSNGFRSSSSASACYKDSGGAGQFRGGLGYLKDIRTLVDGHYLCNVERTTFRVLRRQRRRSGSLRAAAGQSWNPAGAPHRLQSRGGAGEGWRRGSHLTTPGGGGWGDPLKRETELGTPRCRTRGWCRSRARGMITASCCRRWTTSSRVYEVDEDGDCGAARGAERDSAGAEVDQPR